MELGAQPEMRHDMDTGSVSFGLVAVPVMGFMTEGVPAP